MRWPTAILLNLVVAVSGCAAETERDWPTTKQLVRDAFPSVKQLTTQELADWLASDRPPPILLDARADDEFAVSRLPRAVSAPDVDAADAVIQELGPSRPVVVYCSVGYRSSALAKALQERGYEGVTNLEGSIFEWANAGRPVVRNGEPVEAVHPYDEDWGQLLDRRLWATEPR